MRVFLAALALLLAAFSQTRDQAGTLRSALRQDGLPVDESNLPDLDRKITSGAELDTPEQFVLAYYLDDGTRNLNPPLTLVRYDKKSKTWQTGSIAKAAAVWRDAEVPCLGSVLDVRSFGEGFLVETHINPSAGCALILSKTFQLEASLYGWALDSFSDGTLVYHRSQIHFATVHPAEIAVFDPRARRDFTIFPPKSPTPERQKLTEQLSEFFKTHHDYCAKANDPCDPQVFDSALDGKIAIDDREHALAFSVSYRLLGYGQDDGKPSGPGRVVYVYRNANDEEKVEVRELSSAEIKEHFGDVTLQDLLDPEHLKVIFQK